ncbi:hypothetical protein BGZ76_008593 [Entomortierella beljakovae]|nr:hypothetical protein BGZ76_008593 [Entomortierella beljakovae]
MTETHGNKANKKQRLSPAPFNETSKETEVPIPAHSDSAPTIAHEEAVGRPVSKSEIPPEIRAKIEKNRLAALQRKAKHDRKVESDRILAQEFGEDIGGGFLSNNPGNKDSRPPILSDVIDSNAKKINEMMKELEPLPKNEWTKFYDYDLTNMKDTRAGFIQEIDGKKTNGTTDEESIKKRKWQPTLVEPDPSIFQGADNYECQDCTSIDIDFQLLRHFHVPVCVGCRDTQPEKYSLLTKTECRMDYLLTDPELRDTELFPYWERPNPKKATWNNMMLYLRYQVEEFAFKKWGGPEGLDQEFEKRERDKESRKEIKFKKELRDLRNKTRTSVWQDKKMKQRAKVHEHKFGTALVDPSSGASVQSCIECGIQVECEEFF